jgi:hypothetical protein
MEKYNAQARQTSSQIHSRPVRQPYAGVNYVPHSGTINLDTERRTWVEQGYT